MKFGVFHIILRSLKHYKTRFLYQFLIIMFLAAVITGSLLTGSSVRKSILTGNTESLAGTGFIISSGNRYLPASLAERFMAQSGELTEGILEQRGWVKNFSSGESALNVQVFGVANSFFNFDSINDSLTIAEGEVIINEKLAKKLALNHGDDIIVRIASPSKLPAGSPFAPVTDTYESFVLSVSYILTNVNEANFSLGINQVKPYNLYLPLQTFSKLFEGENSINRILVKSRPGLDTSLINKKLQKIYSANDAGLKIREIEKSHSFEIISDRIFISKNELDQVLEAIPEARPVLTYLANSISKGDKHAPYSFIAGLHHDLIDIKPSRGEIIINRWLADDLNAKKGDTLKVDYFVEGNFKDFVEKSEHFVVCNIIETESEINDPDLMPEFPGISGSESCRDWDAGAPVDMNRIRDKDEDYWYDYNGTPKAIISYQDAALIWGNDFGPATAIRFTADISNNDIKAKLEGSISPFLTGVSIIPIEENALNAAKNSVDFTSLFLGLGFFILLSAFILLILVVSAHLESRYDQIRILRSLGFKDKLIISIQFIEVSIIAVSGALAGIFVGDLIDNLLIGVLNSVWSGAVQTNTLQSYSSISSQLLGFTSTLVIVLITLRVQLGKQLKKASAKDIKQSDGFIIRNIKPVFVISGLITIVFAFLACIEGINSSMIWFVTGSLILLSLIIGITYILKTRVGESGRVSLKRQYFSRAYFRMYPGRAITPVIFLAAGLFIVIVTGANRKSFEGTELSRDSSSGGFMIWGETATPLLYDMNSSRGKYEYNLESEALQNTHFIQAKKVNGDDASCLNLNQVESPPILGINTDYFSEQGAFSFASKLDGETDPWSLLSKDPADNIIYGIADQTIMQWSLYKEVGDTLLFTAESGEELRVVLVGGLNSSVFQGHVIIGANNFRLFYPSISGSTIFLAEGEQSNIDNIISGLSESLSQFGVDIQSTPSRLTAFYEVTNTYLDVFISLGGIGMILGVIGMGFVLLRNFNFRKKEYALLLATGYSKSRVRNSIIIEHLLILSVAIIAALISAPIATLPSLLSEALIPYKLILLIIFVVYLTGGLAILISVRSLLKDSLVGSLRKE